MGDPAPDAAGARWRSAAHAVARERERFGRDLHDLLGGSLTVIAVKAELARRLLDTDPDRARAELAELEQLSRETFVDLRRAVDGYRVLDLSTELDRARSALLAAGIRPQLAADADIVAPDLQELFAWTVREGVTNVIRHSRARTCTVRLGPHRVEVGDDGRGLGFIRRFNLGRHVLPRLSPAAGTGLAGLRERAAEAGAQLEVRRRGSGHVLLVSRR